MIARVNHIKKLLYVEIPKAGCTTIDYELFWKPLFGDNQPREITCRFQEILGSKCTFHLNDLTSFKDYFKFTVVRDPYTRFMSAFYFILHNNRLSPIVQSLGISHWTDDIFGDPNIFIHRVNKSILNRNPHTALQTILLPKNLTDLDYIGQLEDMDSVEKCLSQVLSEKIQFGWWKKQREANNYYPLKIDAEKFNDIFMEDYETLGKFYQPLRKAQTTPHPI